MESKVAGYQQLAAYLPFVQLDPHNSSDFLYQINRPRTAESVPGLILNRLSRWSVTAQQELGIGIPLNPSQPMHTMIGREAYACRLELDINTDAKRTESLPHDSLGQLFMELVRLGKVIVSTGDTA